MTELEIIIIAEVLWFSLFVCYCLYDRDKKKKSHIVGCGGMLALKWRKEKA